MNVVYNSWSIRIHKTTDKNFIFIAYQKENTHKADHIIFKNK